MNYFIKSIIYPMEGFPLPDFEHIRVVLSNNEKHYSYVFTKEMILGNFAEVINKEIDRLNRKERGEL
ncbi:MAG: hypothetical protein EOM23_10245 [Candidatus Moranbacteria bacterium]|nr:hypothetical protein [Candidatus Moranbacteria bacterium]